MNYTITLSPDGAYIILKVVGDINRTLALKINLAAHQLGSEVGVNKYLMDLTESKNLETIADQYSFAYGDMHETPQIDRFAVVAMLTAPDDRSHDFIEVVANNAGLNVTLFSDREQAIEYLLAYP
jgi:hypothetical protein